MRLLFTLLFISTTILSTSAFAALGGKESASSVTRFGAYRLHEISKNWVTVHEFSGDNGSVFAVAWSGKKHPDLGSLLGAHLIDFQTALAQARKAHHHGGAISVTVGNFHVEMGGHAGAVYGQTWLTDQVPAGMDVHEIK
jgi:hypothetical protein